MVMPGMLSASRTARLLDVPESFLPLLSEHHVFPCPDGDGAYDVRMVRMALSRLPWLRRLGVPLCDRELALIDPRLTVPPVQGVRMGVAPVLPAVGVFGPCVGARRLKRDRPAARRPRFFRGRRAFSVPMGTHERVYER